MAVTIRILFFHGSALKGVGVKAVKEFFFSKTFLSEVEDPTAD